MRATGLLYRAGQLLLVVIFSFFCLIPVRQTAAANLSNRSVFLDSITAGATTNHQFEFDLDDPINLGSVAFHYCEAPLVTDPCVAPSGIDVSAATLNSESGETGFSIHPNTTSNRLVISRTPALTVPGTSVYEFGNILNPDTANHTTYVRITTYTNTDASGSFEDNGAVAFSLTPALGVSVFVPPYLSFCVGITVGLECQGTTGLSINLGVLSAGNTSAATSQFAGATNDESGYSVSVHGTTMTSGNNEIARLSAPTAATAGLPQFGLNLRANTNPVIGSNPEGLGTLTPTASYSSPNLFAFNPAATIASSPIPTDYNRMTVSYMVNVSPNQHPGIYSTTMTYIAVASF